MHTLVRRQPSYNACSLPSLAWRKVDWFDSSPDAQASDNATPIDPTRLTLGELARPIVLRSFYAHHSCVNHTDQNPRRLGSLASLRSILEKGSTDRNMIGAAVRLILVCIGR